MERKSKSVQEEAPALLTYRKLGGGSLRLPGRIIKPGQVFKAKPEEIPAGFRNLVQLISDEETVKAVSKAKEVEAKKLQEPEDLFVIVPVEGKEGFFNVINSVDKKAINDKPLKEKAAKDLKASLEED